MAAPADKVITGYSRSGRPIYGTAVGSQYRADVAMRHTRATARKASLLDKLLTQAAQLREATGVDILEEAAVKDIMATKGAIYAEKTLIENGSGSIERYRELLRDEAPLESRYIKALSKALKERAPASVAAAKSVIVGLAADEEAEVDELDAELMGLMGGLKMGGGARRRRTSRRHRKSQRRH